MYKNKNGFTLVELLLVVIIIGVLSSVVLSVLNISGIRAKSRDAQRASDLKRIQTSLELYFADNRGFPANSGSWLNLTTGGGGVVGTALVGPHIQALPQDPMNGTAMPSTQCGQSNYGYWYKTDTCAPAGSCLAARYVIMTFMETASAADSSLCSSLVNCTALGCNACANPCYGVENPL